MKMHKSVINTMEVSMKELQACAIWASSISLNELDGKLFSGVNMQRLIGKTEHECAKYLYRNFKEELSGIVAFNQELGINFQ